MAACRTRMWGGRCLRGAVPVAAALMFCAPLSPALAGVPEAEVLGGFEARLSWTDPALGEAVILTLIIFPSNVGSSEGVFTCDQAASTGDRSQTHTQHWDARYEPVEVEIYVHALQRCSGDWEAGEHHPFRLEIYQLPGYSAAASAATPLLVVDGDAPVGEAMSGMRPAGTPMAAKVRVTPSDPGMPATSTTPAGTATTGTGAPGSSSPGGETATTVPRPPLADGSQPWGALFPAGSRGWTASAVAILILFVTLMLLAAGLTLKAAVAGALMVRPGDVPAMPTPGETATLAGDVGRRLSSERPVTVGAPVRPRSSPDREAAPAGFVLQPGQPYVMVGGEGAGPSDWVRVRQGDDTGWVHRSTVQDWHPEVIVVPRPPGASDYRERVQFANEFDVRDPAGSNYTRRPPGAYLLGPPGADGFRPVYASDGALLGSLPGEQVPTTLTRGAGPPPPPLPAP